MVHNDNSAQRDIIIMWTVAEIDAAVSYYF